MVPSHNHCTNFPLFEPPDVGVLIVARTANEGMFFVEEMERLGEFDREQRVKHGERRTVTIINTGTSAAAQAVAGLDVRACDVFLTRNAAEGERWKEVALDLSMRLARHGESLSECRSFAI